MKYDDKPYSLENNKMKPCYFSFLRNNPYP